jgi:hypothetical protein
MKKNEKEDTKASRIRLAQVLTLVLSLLALIVQKYKY